MPSILLPCHHAQYLYHCRLQRSWQNVGSLFTLACKEFVNADEIARGLSPFNVESVAFEAGRLMLQRIDYLMKKGVDFALETTLSTRSYVQTIRLAKESNYKISLYYVWLPSAEVSKMRVAQRVSRGGHNIPPDVIERRYSRSLFNLVNLYIPICDYFTVIDNAGTVPEIISTGGVALENNVFNAEIWAMIQGYEAN